MASDLHRSTQLHIYMLIMYYQHIIDGTLHMDCVNWEWFLSDSCKFKFVDNSIIGIQHFNGTLRQLINNWL